jgi:hypothetical protein
MTTYAPPIGTASPLPQSTDNPKPIVGASVVQIVSSAGILPQAAANPIPIRGASVVAILFPTVQGGSFGGPI